MPRRPRPAGPPAASAPARAAASRSASTARRGARAAVARGGAARTRAATCRCASSTCVLARLADAAVDARGAAGLRPHHAGRRASGARGARAHRRGAAATSDEPRSSRRPGRRAGARIRGLPTCWSSARAATVPRRRSCSATCPAALARTAACPLLIVPHGAEGAAERLCQRATCGELLTPPAARPGVDAPTRLSVALNRASRPQHPEPSTRASVSAERADREPDHGGHRRRPHRRAARAAAADRQRGGPAGRRRGGHGPGRRAPDARRTARPCSCSISTCPAAPSLGGDPAPARDRRPTPRSSC